MPVILKIEQKDGQRTAVWNIQEDEDSLLKIALLNTTELHTFSLITNPGRRLEWLAVRALLRDLYPARLTIRYHENGKPLLVDHSDKISISHSGKMVGIISHPTQNPGIDIEMIHPRILKIASRFLSELEKIYIGEPPSIQQLTIIWAAKEVMFKVYEHGGISFKNDFMVKPFLLKPKGNMEGIINKNGVTSSIPMEYLTIGNFTLIQTNYTEGFEKNMNFGTL